MIVFVEVPQTVGVAIPDLMLLADMAKQAHRDRIDALNKLRELDDQGFVMTAIEDRQTEHGLIRIYTLECKGEETQLDPESAEPMPMAPPYGG